MKKFCLCLIFVLLFASTAGATQFKRHEEYMKNADYKEAYKRYTDALEYAKSSLDAEDYKRVMEWIGDGDDDYDDYSAASAASVFEDEIGLITSVTDWLKEHVVAEMDAGAVREMVSEGGYTGTTYEDGWLLQRLREWLKRNANGVQGYYVMKNDSFDGEMTVLEVSKNGKDGMFDIFISVKNSGANESGDFLGGGELKNGMMTIYAEDYSEGKMEIFFDGEAAKVETDKSFKETFGVQEVILDGEYVRERQ